MAHELTRTDNLSLHGDTSWHALENPLARPLPLQEMIQETPSLAFEPIALPLYANLDGREIVATDSKLIVRPDTGDALGTVGIGYQPVAYRRVGEVIDNAFRAAYGRPAEFCGAGTFRGGRECFFQVRLGDFDVNGDAHKEFFLGGSSHDESESVWAKRTETRVVCHNTRTAALGDGRAIFSARHTSGVLERLPELERQLMLMLQGVESSRSAIQKLADARWSFQDCTDYWKMLFEQQKGPRSKAKDAAEWDAYLRSTIDELAGAYMRSDNRSPGTQDSAYQGYNAVSYRLDRILPRWSAKSPFGSREEARVYRNLLGSAASEKSAAFELALSLV